MKTKNLTFKCVKTEDLNFIISHPRKGRNTKMFNITDRLHNVISIERLRKTLFLVVYKKNNEYLSSVLDIKNLNEYTY